MLYRRLLYRWMLYQSSHRSDEIWFDVYFDGRFFMCPLKYEDETILDLRLPMLKRLTFKEMNDLLLDKTKEDIWKWFYCKPKCTFEEGLTIVENDRDIEKMFEVVKLQGAFDLYVCPIPQVCLVEYYFKNLDVVFESDEEVTSIYRASTRKGKVVLDDFEDVANRKGKVVLDDFADVGNGKENHEWEYLLDIDDSDLQLSAPLHLSNSSNTSLLQTQEMYVDEKATRIIPGPAEYVRKLIGDVSETDDFKLRPWITALEFINDNRKIGGGCFGDIKSYLKKGKFEKVVAIITSCTPNVLGDINVTLKDPSGTYFGTIHYEVLLDDGYDKAIKVGYALILHNVSVFCDKSSYYYLNIITKNLVKIFQKDTVVEDADGASCNNI
ncbi:transposase, MuDR, MULE transposase domain protein [Tanacetum coccineum]